jgi:hypothetical protein
MHIRAHIRQLLPALRIMRRHCPHSLAHDQMRRRVSTLYPLRHTGRRVMVP